MGLYRFITILQTCGGSNGENPKVCVPVCVYCLLDQLSKQYFPFALFVIEIFSEQLFGTLHKPLTLERFLINPEALCFTF